jgi:hypothetical protein
LHRCALIADAKAQWQAKAPTVNVPWITPNVPWIRPNVPWITLSRGCTRWWWWVWYSMVRYGYHVVHDRTCRIVHATLMAPVPSSNTVRYGTARLPCRPV